LGSICCFQPAVSDSSRSTPKLRRPFPAIKYTGRILTTQTDCPAEFRQTRGFALWIEDEEGQRQDTATGKRRRSCTPKEALRQIELETGRALRQIRNEVADLSFAIASKVIQRNFTKEDNDRLVQETSSKSTPAEARSN
jgi:hypothetical protein